MVLCVTRFVTMTNAKEKHTLPLTWYVKNSVDSRNFRESSRCQRELGLNKVTEGKLNFKDLYLEATNVGLGS